MKMVRHQNKFMKQVGFLVAVIEESLEKNLGNFR